MKCFSFPSLQLYSVLFIFFLHFLLNE
jgi:hypothetical protein